jgi:hypothetical protein
MRRGAERRSDRARADRDERDVHAGVALDEPDVVAGLRRQVLEPLGPLDVALPSGERLVDRLHLVDHGLVVRHVVVAGAVLAEVPDAHLELGKRRKDVELCDCELGTRVQPRRVLHHDEVEPAGAAATLGVGAELGTAIDQQITDLVALVELGREGAGPDARRVRLHHADDALDVARPDAGAGADRAGHRVARRHERIRPVVEVEEHRLRALEQHPLSGVERVVHEVHGVVDQRRETRRERQVLLGERLRVDGQSVVHLGEDAVLLPQGEVQLLPEDLRVEQVLDSQADAHRLVGVRGTDAALGGAQLRVAEIPLVQPVQLLVVRHDQVRIAREPEATRLDAAGLERVELGEQHVRVHDHAVADDRHDPGVEDPARHELELEHLAVDDERVPGVVAALVADAQRSLFRQVVGEPTLALVTPLGADDHCSRHDRSPPDTSEFVARIGPAPRSVPVLDVTALTLGAG